MAENFGTSIEKGTSFLSEDLMSRRPLMAGNWKMYKTPAETHAFFEAFKPLVADATHCDIVICPPFPNLPAAVEGNAGHATLAIGAQNLYWGKEGAFTGEVSGHMLQAVGCSTSSSGTASGGSISARPKPDVVRKTQAALESGLTPIVCVGERLEEREVGTGPKPCSGNSSTAALRR